MKKEKEMMKWIRKKTLFKRNVENLLQKMIQSLENLINVQKKTRNG